MILFYLACFWGSFLCLLWGAVSKSKRSQTQLLSIAIVIITNGGYLALATAKNLEEALLANKLAYIGGCFLPLVFFLVICELCRIRFSTRTLVVMYSVQTILFFFVCSIGFSDIYYKSAQFQIVKGVGCLIKEYGPLHVLYPLTMYSYLVASIIVLIISLKRHSIVSKKNTMNVMFGFFVATVVFAIEKILKFKLEFMPIVNTLVMLIVIPSVGNINKYNVRNNVDIFEKHMQGMGYIAFDKRLNYMGSNRVAMAIFPELEKYSVDEPVPVDGSVFREIIINDLRQYVQGHRFVKGELNFSIGDEHYEYDIEDIKSDGRKCDGYIVNVYDVTERYNHLKMLEGYNRNLESEVMGKTHKIREIQEKTLLGMAQMVESRDLSTGGHIKRTSLVVGIFAKELFRANLGLGEEFLYYVQQGAPMHDLGKIAVDDHILRKQGKFTEAEYEEMKRHSEAGAKIVENILTGIEDETFVNIAINIAHYHHEKVNGKGYPEGLVGEGIPIEARIMALADVFDALVSKRCYKEAFSFDKAFDIIREDSGTHFDPKLAEIFIACRPELEALYGSFEEE